MPRYFFDVVDGEEFVDDVGTVLAGRGEMRLEAARFVSTLLAEDAIRRGLGVYWSVKVRDEAGQIMLELRVYE